MVLLFVGSCAFVRRGCKLLNQYDFLLIYHRSFFIHCLVMELGVSLSKNIYYSQPIFLLNSEKFEQEPLGYFLLVDMFHFPPSLLGDPIESNF